MPLIKKMNVLTDYNELKRITGFSFQQPENKEITKRIVGILFAQPNSFTNDEILSGIDYFNNRSGKTIDFFCAGYKPSFFDKNLEVITNVGGNKWSFDSKIFNNIRKETESLSKWKYSGNVELVLFNVAQNGKEIELDFSDSISIDLLIAKNDKLIDSAGSLFEEIFRLSENLDTSNPSKSLSLKLIGDTAKKSFIPILMKLLPKQIQNHSKKIYLFRTEDKNNKTI